MQLTRAVPTLVVLALAISCVSAARQPIVISDAPNNATSAAPNATASAANNTLSGVNMTENTTATDAPIPGLAVEPVNTTGLTRLFPNVTVAPNTPVVDPSVNVVRL